MAQAIIERTKLLAFINGFGDNIEDLQLEIKDNRVYGSVDTPTHYCEKSISVMVSNDIKYRPGKVYMSDVAKVATFLKASSQDLSIMTQWDGSFNLKLGNDSLQIPSHTNIRSALTVDRAKAAIADMKRTNFTKIGPSILSVNGNIDIIEMKGMGVGVKIAGKDAPCRVRINPMDAEMTITMGNIVGGSNMSRVIQLSNVWGEIETTTYFGSHLPNILSCMDSGMVDFYMGEHAALVLDHQEYDTLLILKHQQGVN
jgi:hypothetical protein